jgi:hypothetical protein
VLNDKAQLSITKNMYRENIYLNKVDSHESLCSQLNENRVRFEDNHSVAAAGVSPASARGPPLPRPPLEVPRGGLDSRSPPR